MMRLIKLYSCIVFVCASLFVVNVNHVKAQDLQFLLPTQGQLSYIQVEGARIIKPGKWNLSAYAHYGRDPLLLIIDGQVEEVLSRYITTTELIAAFGVHDRIELGVALPYSFSSGIAGTFPVDDAQGLGDIRLNPKVIIIKPKETGLGLGINAMSILPTGNRDREASEQRFVRRNFSTLLNLFGEYLFTKGRVALNLGYRFRPERGFFDQLTDLDVTSGPTWGAAGGYNIDEDLELTAEIFQRFMTFNRSPVEGLFGLRSTRKGAFNIHFGMGAGIGGDYSSVGLRVLGGLTWTPQPTVVNSAMPMTDQDGDGLIDLIDRCPTQPEDKDGHEDQDGCPEDDVDNDGIKDQVDRCPKQPEDKDNFQDEDGCPELDNDGDGLQDQLDRCPNKAENFNNFEDHDGCPEEAPVPEEGELISLSEKIFFKHNESIILQRSFPILSQVAELMKKHPKINKVRIEGHTDDTGGIQFNQKLSQERAEAVQMHLIGLGITSNRLEAVGYGDKRPIASNDTDEGKALNRRVDFRIIQGPQEIFKVDPAPPPVPQSSLDTPSKSLAETKNKPTPKTLPTDTSTKKKVLTGDKFYGVQVKASYRLKDAEEIRDELMKERFPAYVVTIEQNGKMIHRVRIGPYGTKREAKKILNEYQARFPDSNGQYIVKLSQAEMKKYR